MSRCGKSSWKITCPNSTRRRAVHRIGSQSVENAVLPFRRYHVADNGEQDLRLRDSLQEKFNAWTLVVKMGGRIVVDSRIRIDVTETVKQHGSAVFQVSDGFTGCQHAAICFV